MLIIWGTKVFRRGQGRVAEVCERCVDVTAHRFSEVRKVSHVYYVPLGFGTPIGHEAACERCTSVVETDPARYTAVSSDRSAALEQLIAETHPDARETLAQWKDLQERAQRGQLDPDERLQVMAERLLPLAQALEERARQVHFDARSLLGILGTIGGPIGVLVASSHLPEAWGAALDTLGLTLGGLGVVFVLHSLATDQSRFVRKQREQFVERLRPFNPSLAELETVLEVYRSNDWAMGRKVKASWLVEQLQSGPGTMAAPTSDYEPIG